MAERFTGQRCQDCQGGLIYNKQDKYWECPYCGKIYERELRFNKVQIDGLAGINDLVRSTLSKLITLDFSGAEKELSECERIDHASVGTLIASLSISLVKSMFTKERQQELTKVNAVLQKLDRDFPMIDEPEEILYDFLDSSELYGLLIAVYGMTNQTQRKEWVFGLLNCAEVYNPTVCKLLLGVLLRENKITEADSLLSNLSAANSKFGITTVLKSYPSTAQKVVHIDNLLSKTDADTDLTKVFDTYFEQNEDDHSVIVDIFLSAVSHKVEFNTTAIIQSVLHKCETVEGAEKVFAAMQKQRLNEETAKAVLSWCSNTCQNCKVSAIGYKSLLESNSVFEVSDGDIIELLQSEQPEEAKIEKINQLLSVFKISNKNIDKLFAYHLLENQGNYAYRKSLFDLFADRTSGIPISVIEEYVLKTTFDHEDKHAFLEAALAKTRNVSLCAGLLSEYMQTAVDAPADRERIIRTFIDHDLLPSSAAYSQYLLNKEELHTDELLDVLQSRSCKPLSDTFDQYLEDLGDKDTYNPKIAAISTQSGYVLRAENFAKYLLSVQEPESQKIENAQKYFQECARDVRDLMLSATVADVEIIGTVTQIYFLTGKDDPYVMQEIIRMLQKEKIKLDIPIEIVATGKKVKLHKFVDGNAAQLDATTQILAKELL